MHHFITVVLVPKDTAEAEILTAVEKLLAPYDEQLEVEPYDEECSCVGAKAMEEIRPAIYAAIEGHSEEFKLVEDLSDFRDNLVETVSIIQRVAQSLLPEHPLRDAADPECKECKGTGVRKTTYNPKSKWDWWRIGGRSDGWIRSLPELPGDGFNFGPQYETLERNVCPVCEMHPASLPDAVVLPDGTWAEGDGMDGRSTASNATWEDQVETIFSQYPDHLAVAVDLHI